jgi:phospholipid/cholesterol/gamma-HCH transport system ATP-binding protein
VSSAQAGPPPAVHYATPPAAQDGARTHCPANGAKSVSARAYADNHADRPPVRIIDLAKSFVAQPVLEGISLDVHRGKTTVVLGPSGSGKSVLLRHIIGLLKPDAGEVWFEDERVDRMAERQLRELRARIGFLFQLSALFDSMTIRENLEFPLKERTKLKRSDRLGRIHASLERVDLRNVEHKRPAELSGGQQKRAALARALMLEPEVMLYDEPTTGLDPIRAAEIDALINKMKRELGVTSVVVTHDLASAAHVGDHIVLIDAGHVLASGTMDELRRSDHPRVQAFLTGDGARFVDGCDHDDPLDGPAANADRQHRNPRDHLHTAPGADQDADARKTNTP